MAAMALQACSQSGVASSSLDAFQTRSSGSSRNAARSAFFQARQGGFAGRSLGQSRSLASGPAQRQQRRGVTVCGLDDFVGGDLLGFDLGQWCDDVEKYGAVGFYAPPEGGAELRYATALKYRGYHFMNVSARGLGDPEAYLLKTHGVRPPHLGKQAVARFYQPGEVDYRLSLLPPRYKGIVVWVGEAKVLSKNELQFLSVLPALRPQVKVVCEMGGSRKFYYKPLKDLVGLPPAPKATSAPAASPLPAELTAQGKKEEAVVSS